MIFSFLIKWQRLKWHKLRSSKNTEKILYFFNIFVHFSSWPPWKTALKFKSMLIFHSFPVVKFFLKKILKKHRKKYTIFCAFFLYFFPFLIKWQNINQIWNWKKKTVFKCQKRFLSPLFKVDTPWNYFFVFICCSLVILKTKNCHHFLLLKIYLPNKMYNQVVELVALEETQILVPFSQFLLEFGQHLQNTGSR